MKAAHLISDELFEQAMNEIRAGNCFIAYNSSQYLLEKNDMSFFNNAADANAYAFDNSCDRDHYTTLKANSVMDIYDHFEIMQSLAAHPRILSHLNKRTMEENNFEYLSKQLQWTGFGEKLQEELKSKMQAAEPLIALFHKADYGKDQAHIRLDFKKAEDKDIYFFNSYTMKLTINGLEDAVAQKFYINNKQDNITVKEAYNMLSGRAVEKEITPKEGEKYRAWLQLDFKETDSSGQFKIRQFHPNYGFALDKVLEKLSLRELENPESKKQLLESLQRGNRQAVTLLNDGKETRIFIEAAPQFKSLNYYDAQQKRVQAHELVPGAAKQASDKEQKQEVKKEKQSADGEDDLDGPKGKKKRKRLSA